MRRLALVYGKSNSTKVLQRANSGDLAVERPSKLTLVVNLRTAKTLGLAVPPTVLLRADHVIE